jgi:hypothetical protein
MMIGRTITLSPHEKGNFRKICSRWTSRKFTTEQFLEWDERELFNLPCLLNVAHTTMDDGNDIAIVEEVSPVLRNMQVTPLPESTPYLWIVLESDKFDQAELDKLAQMPGRFAQDTMAKIMSSPEWAALTSGESATDDDGWPGPETNAQASEDGNWNDADEAAAEPEPEPEPAPKAQVKPPVRPAQQQAKANIRPGAPAPAAKPMQQVQRPSGPAPARPTASASSTSMKAVSNGAAGNKPAARPAAQQPRQAGAKAPMTLKNDEIPW